VLILKNQLNALEQIHILGFALHCSNKDSTTAAQGLNLQEAPVSLAFSAGSVPLCWWMKGEDGIGI
jgi:hypothetical protein